MPRPSRTCVEKQKEKKKKECGCEKDCDCDKKKKKKEKPTNAKEQTRDDPPPPAYQQKKDKPKVKIHSESVIEPDEQIDVEEDFDNTITPLRKKRIDPEVAPTILPFNIYDLGLDYTMGFFGKRREGKSFLMRYFMYHMKEEFPRVYVFSNTLLNNFWQRCVPEGKCFDGYQPGVLRAILDYQTEFIKENRQLPEEAQANERLMIILDDCISQDLHHDPVLKDVFFNGRHLKICLLISMQYARGIPPGFRENLDIAIGFRLHSIAQKEGFCENFLGHFKKDVALKLLEEYCWQDAETGERQAIVIDTSGRKPIDEMVSAIQGMEVPEFKVGCKEFWEGEPDPAKPPKKSAPSLVKKKV